MTSTDSGKESTPLADRPALVIVDDRPSTREIVVDGLRRRFGVDYDVIEAPSIETANAALDRLHTAGRAVAVVSANVEVDGATAFLAKARDRFPTARRLVLSLLGDNWVLPAISRAAALGEVDHWDYLPASETDEHFLSVMSDILVEWNQDTGRGTPRITVIGEFGSPEFKVVTDVLQRWEPEPIATLEAGTPEADAFLREHDIDGPIPIVALSDGRAISGASIASISDAIGSGADPSATTYDVAVLGLGPAGFSAAVNAASEGLRTILVNDTFSQASSSPLVRNYLGFPAGITGAELMRRAWSQAMLFGAEARIGRHATGIRREDGRNIVSLDDGSEITASAVLLGIGVDYRRIGVERVDALVGRGVFYGYGALEAQAMTGKDAAVVGGANSAVQAALHVARYARSVRLIVRGGSMDASEYLISQLDGYPAVTVHLESEVIDARDEQRLRSISLRNRTTGAVRDVDVSGLFIMIGATPRTEWLPASIARDPKGFVLTGDDAARPEAPEELRLPYETTLPGVFAMGDVRSGSVKRIAAAVGEGSAAVAQVHRYLGRMGSGSAAAPERSAGEPLRAGTAEEETTAARG
jgi:thioredoxin reductase (NADPH)